MVLTIGDWSISVIRMRHASQPTYNTNTRERLKSQNIPSTLERLFEQPHWGGDPMPAYPPLGTWGFPHSACLSFSVSCGPTLGNLPTHEYMRCWEFVSLLILTMFSYIGNDPRQDPSARQGEVKKLNTTASRVIIGVFNTKAVEMPSWKVESNGPHRLLCTCIIIKIFSSLRHKRVITTFWDTCF